MILFMRIVRMIFVSVIALVGVCVIAADPQQSLIELRNVRTVDDIVYWMPARDFFNLRIRFAAGVDSATRTRILSTAFVDERAARIRKLDLMDNNLVRPPVLTSLRSLQELDLSNNLLIEPPLLTGLTDLIWLFLNRNELTQPPVLTGLVNLQYLDLAHNRLVQPPELTGLVNLIFLFLHHNRLVEPPVLDGLQRLYTVTLSRNPLARPVEVPLALAHRIKLTALGVPYNLGGQEPHLARMTLVDIAQPGIDSVPFFFTHDSISRLPVPQINPLTRREILQTMNLAESWRYWRDHGITADVFDVKLREVEPIALEENLYTVSRAVARAFMQERGVPEARMINILAALPGESIQVTALLDALYPAAEQQAQPRADAPVSTAGEPPAKKQQ